MLMAGNLRIFLAFKPVDMRLAFDGLAARIQHELKLDPYGGECFVFRSKSGNRLKMLLWDGIGFWLYYRRLEQGIFIWPEVNDQGVIELTQAQFAVLTQGLDWRRVRYAQQLAPTLT